MLTLNSTTGLGVLHGSRATSFQPKEPTWLPIFGNEVKRFDVLFFSSKFAKLENSATGLSAATMRL